MARWVGLWLCGLAVWLNGLACGSVGWVVARWVGLRLCGLDVWLCGFTCGLAGWLYLAGQQANKRLAASHTHAPHPSHTCLAYTHTDAPPTLT
eukprot:360979-Chlamydomonas_euryale.AAC.4